jgi:ribonuclease HI
MYPARSASRPLFEPRENPPQHYLIAHSDGGARGNPGPAGYGVVIQDESGRKVAALSEYLGHQTNNFAEYQGLIAALEYAIKNGPKALKLISDSELLVRQIKGIYKVKNAVLQDLHARAKELIAQLDWFSIGHALREQNKEADQLANEAMDKGMGRSGRTASVGASAGRVGAGGSPATASSATTHVAADASSARSSNQTPQELEGIVRNGVVELTNGKLPEGAKVQLRVKK